MPRKRPVIAELERFYLDFQDELRRLEERVVLAGMGGTALRGALCSDMEAKREALTHLAFCLRLCDAKWHPGAGIRRRKRARSLDRGHLLSKAYDVLRQTERPLTSAEIMVLSTHRQNGISAAEARSSELRSALTLLLRGEERRGAVTSHGKRPIRWEIRLSEAELRARVVGGG